MMMKLRFNEKYGSLQIGDVAECGDTDGAELVARKIASPADKGPISVSAPAVIVLPAEAEPTPVVEHDE